MMMMVVVVVKHGGLPAPTSRRRLPFAELWGGRGGGM